MQGRKHIEMNQSIAANNTQSYFKVAAIILMRFLGAHETGLHSFYFSSEREGGSLIII